MSPTHTIRAYYQGKKVYEVHPDIFSGVEEIVDGIKSRLLDGSADFIEITDHTNARKTRRIYSPHRRKT